MIWKRIVKISFFLAVVSLWAATSLYAQDDSGLSELIEVPIIGLGTVLITLILLAVVCSGIGRYFISQDKAAQAKKAAAAPAVSTAAPQEAKALDEISPELIAILSAAAESALRKPVAIVRVAAARDHWWAVQGRQAHHHSRKTR